MSHQQRQAIFIAMALFALAFNQGWRQITALTVNIGAISLARVLAEHGVFESSISDLLEPPGVDTPQTLAWLECAGRKVSLKGSRISLEGKTLYLSEETLFRGEDTRQAASLRLERATRLHPGDYASRLYLGLAYRAVGRTDRSRHEWQAIGAERYFVEQCEALWRRADYLEALTQCETALDINSTYARGYYAIGKVHFQLHEVGEGEYALGRAIALEPSMADAYHWMGRSLMVRADPDDARRYWSQATVLAPGAYQFYVGLGDVAMQVGDLQAARASYQHAANLAPGAPEPQYGLGVVAYSQGEFGEATVRFERATAIKSDNPAYHLYLARTYREQKRMGDADVEFQLALQYARVDVDLGWYYFEYADFLTALGAQERARRLYEVVFQVYPGTTWADQAESLLSQLDSNP